jgi:hypothetical protein
MKNLFKKTFGKKEVTKDDKIVNLIVNFIKRNYSVVEYTSDSGTNIQYYIRDMWAGVILYYSKTQRTLYYRRDLAQDIFNFIPDNRLLQPDSKLMGKVFEKLYKNKVRNVSGYQHTLIT